MGRESRPNALPTQGAKAYPSRDMDDEYGPSDAAFQLPFRAIVEHLPVVVYVDAWDVADPADPLHQPHRSRRCSGTRPTSTSNRGTVARDRHPDDLLAMRAQLAACATAGTPYEMHYRFVHPDGRDVWVRDRATPYRDPETGERRWMGALEDVTARVEAEQAEALSTIQYETLAGEPPGRRLRDGPRRRASHRYMNRKIEDLLGYTMEEWLDQPDMWMEVLHPDDREGELAAHDLASDHRRPVGARIPHDRRRGPGGVGARPGRAVARHRRERTRWQGVMMDITAEKEAQLALAAAHDELEFRVRARTAALQETNELMGIEIAERQRAEDERLRAEQQLGHILDNVPAVVYLWQMREADDGTFSLFITPKIAEMLGYSPTEWADGGWRTRLHPHDQRPGQRGRPSQHRTRRPVPDGIPLPRTGRARGVGRRPRRPAAAERTR